jgi:hypothetical protein
LSNSIKNKARKRLNSALISDQEPFKRFLIKYQRFVLLTLEVDISAELNHFVRYFEEVAVGQSPVKALKLFKQLYDLSLRFVTSNSFNAIPYLKSTPDGFPYILKPIERKLKGTLNERRGCLAALSIFKILEQHDSNFSVETIVREGPIKRLPIDADLKIGNYFRAYFDRYPEISEKVDLYRLTQSFQRVLDQAFPYNLTKRQERLNDISKESGIHISGRNGPNGPCLTTAVIDHCSLTFRDTNNNLLINTIKEISQMTSNKDLNTLLENFEEEDYIIDFFKTKKDFLNSRISLKREPWAKVRPFAICDYFSQSALKGFHKHLFKWLREQPEDGTFKQDEVSENVRIWTMSQPTEEDRVESADLSAATDCIPIDIQTEIVAQIAGHEFARKWKIIATERSFKAPDGTMIAYKTGQPMGLLSSWAMLSVWHHIIVRTCLDYCRIDRSRRPPVYHVIGDDVSMKGSQLFSLYKLLVETIQGVKISVAKGFHKETQHSENPILEGYNGFMHTAELAKRVFCNGQEITIIPPDEVKTSLENAIQFPTILYSLRKRGYRNITMTDLPTLTALCYHKRLALLLATSPIHWGPLEVTPIEMSDLLLTELPWFKPEFDENLFKQNLIHRLKEKLIATLRSTVANLNNWFKLAIEGGEVKVKGWAYTCETQGLLIFLVSQECKNTLERLLDNEELSKVFPKNGEINHSILREYLGQLQVLFEIDYLFKEKDIQKEVSRNHFINSIIYDVIKKMASEAATQVLKPVSLPQ